MKKHIKGILGIAIVVAVAFLLVITIIDFNKQPEEMGVPMVSVDHSGEWWLWADKDTKVMYISRKAIGMTALLNADGTPRLYEGEMP